MDKCSKCMGIIFFLATDPYPPLKVYVLYTPESVDLIPLREWQFNTTDKSAHMLGLPGYPFYQENFFKKKFITLYRF